MPIQSDIQQTATRKSKGWHTFWKAVKVVVAVIGLAGTGLTIFQVYRWLGADPYVKFTVLDNRCLTRIEAIPDLKCTYNFKGSCVNSLWVSRILLRNCCQRNIIGTSYHDLMSTNISFVVSDNYKILNLEIERNEFGANVLNLENGFSVEFRKWRPEECCILSVYIEGENVSDTGPEFKEAFESFTQGRVEISEPRQDKQSLNIIKRWPHWFLSGIKWLGVVVYLFLLGLSLWGVFINIKWIRLFKRWRWNIKHLDKVEQYISDMAKSSDTNSININYLPDEFWIENKIPKPPKDSEYVKGKKLNMSEIIPIIILCFIGLLLSFIALVGLFCI